MTGAPLEDLDEEAVKNVYIFLADAVRHDALPDAVARRGLSFKTVAHALATPQCLPTIVSGQLPPKHGVTWFQHTMRDFPTIFDLDGFQTGYSELLWPGHALQDVLGEPGEAAIESVEEPFVVFEHDNGGHAPYPEVEADNPAEMLREIDSDEKLCSLYEKTVQGSADRFVKRLEILDDRGVLDETLVIYMADHGELLGERGGFFGHGLPLTPEVAYVPMVFLHPSLPEGESGEHLLQQVDLYPTIKQALTGQTGKSDGDVLTDPLEPDRPAYSQGIMQPPAKYRETYIDPGYDARGIWTEDGGHVFVQNPRLVRCVTAAYEAVLSGNTGAYNAHRNVIGTMGRTLSHYLRNNHKYGSPSISKKEAEELLNELSTTVKKSEERDLTEETLDNLADLGYR